MRSRADKLSRFTALAAVFLGLTVAPWSSTALADVPANDPFASPTLLSGPLPIEVSGSNTGATKEQGESPVSFSAAGHTVWFEWVAPNTEWVTIGSCTGSLYPNIGIFEGISLGSLSTVVRHDSLDTSEGGQNCGWIEREYTIRAIAGHHYVIDVDGSTNPSIQPPASEGSFLLHIEPTPAPPNDDFAAATPLEGEFFGEDDGYYRAEERGYNWGATKEAGEPDHAADPGGASVWYRWTAPTSGTAEFSTSCCPVWPPVIGLYQGDNVYSLSMFGSGERFTAPISQGQTYLIAVDGQANSGEGVLWMGSFLISVSMSPPPVLPIGGPVDQPFLPTADTISPNTMISKRSLAAPQRTATFDFRSSEPSGGFQCKLDNRPFAACRSPKTYRHLSAGKHTFRVKALDASGNRDTTPAVARFQISESRPPAS